MDAETFGPEPHHVAVLPLEVLSYLAPAGGQTIADATVGAGGHSRLVCERIGPEGRLVGLDRDAAMLALARSQLAGLSVTLYQANFDQLREGLDELRIEAVDGVLADLGVCSDQLDDLDGALVSNRQGRWICD